MGAYSLSQMKEILLIDDFKGRINNFETVFIPHHITFDLQICWAE